MEFWCFYWKFLNLFNKVPSTKAKKWKLKKKKNTCELEVTDRIIEQHMTELQTGNKKIVISVYRSLPPPQASYHQGWNHVD